MSTDIARHAPMGMFAMDGDFRIVFWNPAVASITGIPAEKTVNCLLFDIFPALVDTDLCRLYDNPKPLKRIDLCLESGELFPEKSRPEENRYYTLRTSLILDRDRVKGSVIMLEDTTEKVLSENALRESERRLSTLMNNLPGMAYRARNDDQWTLEYVSKGSTEIVGYDSSDLQGNPLNKFSERVHADDQKKIWEQIHSAVADKKSFELFYRLRTTRGEYKWVWEQGTGVFDDDGRMVALEGYVNDFTAQKVTELELRRENERLRSSIKDRYRFGDMIGKSEAMQTVYETILKAAATDTNVIIYGESGTGKELAARAIHQLSERRDHPFVTLNCGAVSETLLESEFFGHAKGSFTGADRDKRGYIEAADGGTLFLDEIGEISLKLQIQLLRVLDKKEFQPVGTTRTKKSDIRIVAATNHNLKTQVKQGRIRQDFFYRIHVLSIHLPRLSERKEDIPLLVDFFLDQYRQKGISGDIPASVKDLFLTYHWPGNVRELQNAVMRYLTMKRIDFMDQDMPVPETSISTSECDDLTSLKRMMQQYEKQILLQMLEKHHWNRTHVARLMDIDRKTLFTKIKNHHLAPFQ
ncbi:MAG: sigma 54-interacting transcriptional regulator [Desulfotignum sp.]|nr:sigma 54-interacting transcriptional regulator [Desulfotignum sp.]